MNILDKGMIHIPGSTEWDHATQNCMQCKTYKLFTSISAFFHLLFSDHGDCYSNCCSTGSSSCFSVRSLPPVDFWGCPGVSCSHMACVSSSDMCSDGCSLPEKPLRTTATSALHGNAAIPLRIPKALWSDALL